jgi:hypothetical protein
MNAQDEITGWFRGRVPAGWFAEPVSVVVDRDEILVTGTLAPPELGGDLSEEARGVALMARVRGFREDTRDQRIRIASEAEHRFERKVSWAARCGDRDEQFTVASVPAMTRLRMPERAVLDTLIDAGIARSRSEALAWCVRLVGRHQAEWIDQLREAMAHVEKVRAEGPDQESGSRKA